MPITRGATKRRSASGRIAPNQASRFVPPIVVAAPAIVITAPIATTATEAGSTLAQARKVRTARMNPRVSPTRRIHRVTPRRLPSNRMSRRGTSSWAAENANGRTPMTVATAGDAPRVSRSGMVNPSPARADTVAWPIPIPR